MGGSTRIYMGMMVRYAHTFDNTASAFVRQELLRVIL